MNALFQAAVEIQEFCLTNHWKVCIIGGFAVARWGQPRATLDVDISLLTGLGNEKRVIEKLLEQFQPREPGVAEFAMESRVLLANAANGIPLDISLAAFPFEEQVIERASEFPFHSDVVLMTASAEDLVVMKAFSGRGQDWVDVCGILGRQRSLDRDYTLQNLQMLCEMNEDVSPVGRLEELWQR
jgi:hypothetical protein